MDQLVRRLFVVKKEGFDIEAQNLLQEWSQTVGFQNPVKLREVQIYDVEGIDEETFDSAVHLIFSDESVDEVFRESFPIRENERGFVIEPLFGQVDQRADAAISCLQALTFSKEVWVRSARLILLEGEILEETFLACKNYCINPIESQEGSLVKPITLQNRLESPPMVEILTGFRDWLYDELIAFHKAQGLAMSIEDLTFCQRYFTETEKRDPVITEIKILDTYWSDHCRHTTFLTKIESVQIEEGVYKATIENALNTYLQVREDVHADLPKEISLMDLATIFMQYQKKQAQLPDVYTLEDVSACTIKASVEIEGDIQDWLVFLKNETHNHPTEIEPFGGAATCLGGAIRDPLSGRAYIYQAIRVTGSADPRVDIQHTFQGKLPQRRITTQAAKGFSSYGNQIGVATSHVAEMYHPDYVAKRLELAAVVGACPLSSMNTKEPEPGDVVILLGGKTGRDSCGGAIVSSKGQTEDCLTNSVSEVQKGNPSIERRLQRLFRTEKATAHIKKCHDLGAGGICVAVGKLTEGIDIDLDAVPKKYQGLDATELAISESHERMAVLVAPQNMMSFMQMAKKENLEATKIATVTEEKRLTMRWRGQVIVDLSRDFLNSNGVGQSTKVEIKMPQEKGFFQKQTVYDQELSEQLLFDLLTDLNICSQRGLVQIFDATIGSGTIHVPFGGMWQLSPEVASIAKIPVHEGETTTGTIVAYGFCPDLSAWSPFHGGMFAVLEAVSKIVACGGDYRKIRLSMQSYFEKPGKYAQKWGKPFSALLGAFQAQHALGIPAIGGKDSMAGNFKDLTVPPTLVAFALSMVHVEKTVSATFQKKGNRVLLLKIPYAKDLMPDFSVVQTIYQRVFENIQNDKVKSARPIAIGGVFEAVCKMAFGNKVGVHFEDRIEGTKVRTKDLIYPLLGSLIVEVDQEEDVEALFPEIEAKTVGYTVEVPQISLKELELSLDQLIKIWESPLEDVFPTKPLQCFLESVQVPLSEDLHMKRIPQIRKGIKPKVCIPVFPGSNGEYDLERAFTNAGASVELFVIQNLTPHALKGAVVELEKRIDDAQILALPSGFSASDEPEGAGKLMDVFLRTPKLADAILTLVKQREGLILGIGNGFQGLVRLGLLPFGEIVDRAAMHPILTQNVLGSHVSKMVQTKVVSTISPWLWNQTVGERHTVAVSHGEGRFVYDNEHILDLFHHGQVATQYVDANGVPTMDSRFNPSGSMFAIEGLTSPCGRILGKMAHSERTGRYIAKNIPGEKEHGIFQAGVGYFR